MHKPFYNLYSEGKIYKNFETKEQLIKYLESEFREFWQHLHISWDYDDLNAPIEMDIKLDIVEATDE